MTPALLVSDTGLVGTCDLLMDDARLVRVPRPDGGQDEFVRLGTIPPSSVPVFAPAVVEGAPYRLTYFVQHFAHRTGVDGWAQRLEGQRAELLGAARVQSAPQSPVVVVAARLGLETRRGPHRLLYRIESWVVSRREAEKG